MQFFYRDKKLTRNAKPTVKAKHHIGYRDTTLSCGELRKLIFYNEQSSFYRP